MTTINRIPFRLLTIPVLLLTPHMKAASKRTLAARCYQNCFMLAILGGGSRKCMKVVDNKKTKTAVYVWTRCDVQRACSLG